MPKPSEPPFVDDSAHDDAGPTPHDWVDYMRYRFETGRAAIARGEGRRIDDLDAWMRAIKVRVGLIKPDGDS